MKPFDWLLLIYIVWGLFRFVRVVNYAERFKAQYLIHQAIIGAATSRLKYAFVAFAILCWRVWS